MCAKRVPNGVQEGAGAQVLRVGALGLAPFGLYFLPVASGVFYMVENRAVR